MKQYIDKAAVVAEIERRLSLLKNGTGDSEVMKRVEGVIKGYKSILSFLDTLEGNGVIAGQECICNGVFNKIIGSSWNLTIPLDKVGLKHGDKVEVLIIKR